MIGDVVKSNYVVVTPDNSVWDVVAAMRSTDSAIALVAAHKADLSAGSVQGIITRKDIMDALAGDMEVFASEDCTLNVVTPLDEVVADSNGLLYEKSKVSFLPGGNDNAGDPREEPAKPQTCLRRLLARWQ